MSNQVLSFYIPRVRSYWTEQNIAHVLRVNEVGVLNRVDFGDFVPSGQTGIRCMFIHLNSFASDVTSRIVHSEIKETGHYRLQVSENEFWMLIPKFNPLQKTHLNIHQLADITRKQEEKILCLEEKIVQLTKRLESQSNPYLNNYCRKIAMSSDSFDDAVVKLRNNFKEQEDYTNDEDYDDNSSDGFRSDGIIITDNFVDGPEVLTYFD
jgi:hypothetical protein